MYGIKAKEFFEENLRLFGNRQGIEKYNLYTGLLNIAKGISQIQGEIQELRNDILRMK